MTTVRGAGEFVDAGVGLLDRERIIAKAGFNRWLVPPAALCIHLCIGMAYGFSVFWLPLSRALGVTVLHVRPIRHQAAKFGKAWEQANEGESFSERQLGDFLKIAPS